MPKANDYLRVQFVAGELEEPLRARAGAGESFNQTARRDLGRYYAILAHMASQFPRAEALLICDAMNGCMLDEHTYSLLWANVADAIALDGLDRKWEVKGPALVERLRALSYAECVALYDQITQFWSDPNPTDAALVRAGLVR